LPDLQSLIQQELSKRQDIPDVLKECLPHQLDFIQDSSLRKAVLGTRRSSKSFMFALGLIDIAIRFPKSSSLYCGLTFDSCEKIMWKDIFDVIFNKYDIDVEYNSSKHHLSFGNGSVIYLYGLDATPKQKHKLRGQKYRLSVIDEVQDFEQDLTEIIEGVLRMTLAQTNAPLWLGGTPCQTILTDHFWWQIHKPTSKLTEWKKFNFNWTQNTAIEPSTGERICDAIQRDVNKQIKDNPLVIETPDFRREVLGEWVIDETTMVYKYNESRNITNDTSIINTLIGNKEWIFILGIDFGWEDADALVTLAYHQHHNKVYVIESEKHSHWTVTQTAKRIQELHNKYSYSFMIADSANAKDINEIRIHHHLPLQPADKLGKVAAIQVLNADLITGNILIDQAANEALIKELQELVWDKKKLQEGILKEISTKDNHLTDAFLYAYRFSRHFNNRPVPVKLPIEQMNNTTDIFQLLKDNNMVPKLSKSQSILHKPSNQDIINQLKQGRL
jgi:hypothetical protein